MVNHAAADDETSSPNNAHAPGATNASLIIEAAAPAVSPAISPLRETEPNLRTPHAELEAEILGHLRALAPQLLAEAGVGPIVAAQFDRHLVAPRPSPVRSLWGAKTRCASRQISELRQDANFGTHR